MVSGVSWLTIFGVCLTKRVASSNVSFVLEYERSYHAPDGYNRSVVTVNGVFPGPDLTVHIGDTVVINVTNRIVNESFTVHWHGIRQNYSNWSDGTEYITNCPIPYGRSYLYVFTVLDAGTFWYHRHDSGRLDGGYGFLVVVDPSEDLSCAEERLILISDWYHSSAAAITAGLLRKGLAFHSTGTGDGVLINGKGGCAYYSDTSRNFASGIIASV